MARSRGRGRGGRVLPPAKASNAAATAIQAVEKVEYLCSACGSSVVGAESSIACDLCAQWCHGAELCTGLSAVLIEEILLAEGGRIRFCCPKCKNKNTVAVDDGN